MRILLDYALWIEYSLNMARKTKARLPKAAEEAKRGAAALAAATRGRARVFKNKKKDADRNACRGKVTEE